MYFQNVLNKNAKGDPPGSPSGADRCTTAPKTHGNLFTGIVCAGLVLTLSVDAYRDKFS